MCKASRPSLNNYLIGSSKHRVGATFARNMLSFMEYNPETGFDLIKYSKIFAFAFIFYFKKNLVFLLMLPERLKLSITYEITSLSKDANK